ncbi:MAG TPA: hypothetical protein VF600_06430 [Abditibacteriaceae bacterium]|jgi:hypothetical protein
MANTRYLFHISAAIALISIVGGTRTSRAQAQTADQAQTLSATELQQDKSLQTKVVSLEAKRRPLRDFLADIGRQSGIGLALDKDSPLDKALVTARVDKMPLAELMGSLAHIYQFSWSLSSNGQYSVRSEAKPTVERIQQRTGHWYRYRDDVEPEHTERVARNKQLVQEILNTVEANMLTLPEGVPVASLPEDMGTRLRKEYERFQADQIRGRFYVQRSIAPDAIVRFNAPAKDAENGLRVTRDGNGSLAAFLAPFAVSVSIYSARGAFLSAMDLSPAMPLVRPTANPVAGDTPASELNGVQ